MTDGGFADTVEQVGKAIDWAGVAVIVIGLLLATVLFVRHAFERRRFDESYRLYRQRVGKAILLGLEFLVAADIIRTVAVSPTFRSVGVLAVIVLVRTFLSFTLEVELEGRWPWQRRSRSEPAA
ncbi:MAG TPA: DUF1622 domain-containing protein [Solirubrobacterales bacterium]|nr:DUF1622 domain-containing protein [Solirubrobacterales bacterium]